MKTFLKILLGFIIGFSLVNQLFATYDNFSDFSIPGLYSTNRSGDTVTLTGTLVQQTNGAVYNYSVRPDNFNSYTYTYGQFMWLIIDPSTLVDNSDIVFSSPGYDNLELFRIHYQTGSLTTTIENRTFTITSGITPESQFFHLQVFTRSYIKLSTHYFNGIYPYTAYDYKQMRLSITAPSDASDYNTTHTLHLNNTNDYIVIDNSYDPYAGDWQRGQIFIDDISRPAGVTLFQWNLSPLLVNPENLYPLGEIDYYPSLVSALSREFYAQAGTTDPFYSDTGNTSSGSSSSSNAVLLPTLNNPIPTQPTCLYSDSFLGLSCIGEWIGYSAKLVKYGLFSVANAIPNAINAVWDFLFGREISFINSLWDTLSTAFGITFNIPIVTEGNAPYDPIFNKNGYLLAQYERPDKDCTPPGLETISGTGNVFVRFGQSIQSASQIIVGSFKPVTGGYYYCLFGKATKVTYQTRTLNVFDYLLIMGFSWTALIRIRRYSIRNEI